MNSRQTHGTAPLLPQGPGGHKTLIYNILLMAGQTVAYSLAIAAVLLPEHVQKRALAAFNTKQVLPHKKRLTS
jgi:hypothetical protein